MPDLNFNDAQELTEYVMKMHEANPNKSIGDVMDWLLNNWATVAWKDMMTIESKNPWWWNKVIEAVNKKETPADEDEIDANLLNPEPGKYSKGMSFLDAANTEDWDDLKWQDKLKVLVDDYNKILWKARDLVKEKSSWYWLSWSGTEKFQTELNEYKQQLEEIENSPEFEQLMEQVAERWTGKLFDNWVMNANINNTLRMIASWEWSKMFADKDRLKNWIDSFETTWFSKFNEELGRSWAPLLWPLGIFNWEDAQMIAQKYLKKNAWKNNEEESKTSWKWKAGSLLPSVNGAMQKATDAMAFWEDVKWEKHLNDRNDKLAKVLTLKWINTEEWIDKFLSQYPSWQNAKQEWKDNTIAILKDKVWEIKATSKKETKKTETKEEKVEDKKPERKTKVWDNWAPSNEDSINWVEETKWDTSLKSRKNTKKEETKQDNKRVAKKADTKNKRESKLQNSWVIKGLLKIWNK